MSKWSPMGSGRRVWAALRDLSRRWCVGVGSGVFRQVTANGSSAGACRARQTIAERPADTARMGAQLQLSRDQIRISTPINSTRKIPLPIPCRAQKIPLPNDLQIKSIDCDNYLIRMELSAICAINFEPRCDAFGVFSLPAGRSRARAAGPASRSLASQSDRSRRSGPTSISSSRSWCIGRSPRCGSARLGRISGIARTRRDASADR